MKISNVISKLWFHLCTTISNQSLLLGLSERIYKTQLVFFYQKSHCFEPNNPLINGRLSLLLYSSKGNQCITFLNQLCGLPTLNEMSNSKISEYDFYFQSAT